MAELIVLTLSKMVPARKKVVKFKWCHKNFMVNDEKYRAIRARFKNKLAKCFWCGHNFNDGEMMSLACPERGLNKMLCHKCVEAGDAKDT